MKKQDNFGTKEVVFLLFITCVVSLTMGYMISNKSNVKQTIDDPALNMFLKNYNYIIDNYYDEIDKEKLLSSAISGMVESLGDEYSMTFDENSVNNFNMRIQGTYSGVGIQIVNDKNNDIIVYQVLSDSPAKQAGIESGDKIISIDGEEYLNKNISELTKYIKSSSNKSFEIVIERNGEQKKYTLERKLIQLKSVYSEMKEEDGKKIGYIYLSLFADNTASQFKNKLEELENQGMDSLIVDVRQNSGGKLSSAVELLSILLDNTKPIYQLDIKGEVSTYYSKGEKTKEYPIVVIQDEESASAAELFSSAMQEQYKATIVGKHSYGKGTVQELVTLPDGTEYKITTKKWLTSKGVWIQDKGVIPDIEVDLTETEDTQLNKAIEYIKEIK